MLQPETIFANRYLLKKKIGVGGFSEVWKATDQMAEDSVVAVKIYAAEKGMDEFGLKQFRREYANMLNVSHEHLVTARHFDIWESRPYLIMPFMEGGSLYHKMMEKGPMEEKEIAEVALQLSKGLSFLHSKGILHQDIKPENVLLDAEGKYHLTDFGISTRLRSTLRKTAAQADRSMTVSYAPPERFSGSQLPTKGGDVFSLGVLMYEMARGELPWMGAGGVVLRSDSAPLELPPGYTPDLAKLINDCVQLNPEDRPSASELVNYCESYLRSGTWGLGSAEAVNSKDEVYERMTSRNLRLEQDFRRQKSTGKIKSSGLLAGEEIAKTMVPIPGGTFILGCKWDWKNPFFSGFSREWPAHKVTLSSFEVNQFEVTQGQWRGIMGSDPPFLWNNRCDRCPVEGVSWNDVQKFIRKLNSITGSSYRLPTETEWEYAARGGNKSQGFKYSGSNTIEEVAWYFGNAIEGNIHGSQKTTRPVGGKKANELGLYDMSGNVWEWCSDWYGNYSGGSRTNPKGPSKGSFRVFRGGSWNDKEQVCRVSFRDYFSPEFHSNFLGFRLAK